MVGSADNDDNATYNLFGFLHLEHSVKDNIQYHMKVFLYVF